VGRRGGPKTLRESFTHDSIQRASGASYLPQLSYNPRARKHKVDKFIAPRAPNAVPPETPRALPINQLTISPAIQPPDRPSHRTLARLNQASPSRPTSARPLGPLSKERKEERKGRGKRKKKKRERKKKQSLGPTN